MASKDDGRPRPLKTHGRTVDARRRTVPAGAALPSRGRPPLPFAWKRTAVLVTLLLAIVTIFFPSAGSKAGSTPETSIGAVAAVAALPEPAPAAEPATPLPVPALPPAEPEKQAEAEKPATEKPAEAPNPPSPAAPEPNGKPGAEKPAAETPTAEPAAAKPAASAPPADGGEGKTSAPAAATPGDEAKPTDGVLPPGVGEAMEKEPIKGGEDPMPPPRAEDGFKARPQFQRVQELLDAYGAGASYFGIALDEQPLSEEEQEGIWRLLYAAGRFQPKQVLHWLQGEAHLAKIAEDPFTTRGDLLQLRGEVRKVEKMTIPPEAQRRLQMKEFYRCEVDLVGGGAPPEGAAEGFKPIKKAIVFSLTVPNAWRKHATLPSGFARTRCDAFFYKRSASTEGVFITARMAWLAPGLLGDRDFDSSLLEQVQNHTRQISNGAFYDMLAMVQKTNPDHLLRLTRVKKGAVEFEVPSVRDWAAFPWRLGNEPAPSPAARIASLLPAELQARLKHARLDRVDAELQGPLVEALNAVGSRADLYDPESWRNQPLNFFDPELGELLREGLRPQGPTVVKEFEKALAAHREALGKARGAAPTTPALEAFFQQAAAGLAPIRLRRFNRLLVEQVFLNEIAPSQPYSVYPLFLTPDSQQGRLMELEGVARQILKVQVTDPEVVQRLKITEYYQICLFTADSQDWPLVLCVRQLPKGLQPGDNLCEYLRVRGFFLQTWRFDSVKSLATRAKAAMAHKTSGQPPAPEEMRMQPPSPLIIAPAAMWVKDGVREQVDFELGVVGLSFLGCTIVGVFLGMLHFQREDLEYKRALLERNITIREEAPPPDWSEVRMEGPPTFDFLNALHPVGSTLFDKKVDGINKGKPEAAKPADVAKAEAAKSEAASAADAAKPAAGATTRTDSAPAGDAPASSGGLLASKPAAEPDPYADPAAFPTSPPFQSQSQSQKPREAGSDVDPKPADQGGPAAT